MSELAAKPAIAYSVAKDDLFLPCKNAIFFAPGVLNSEAALCAEMCRLAYCHPDSNFSFNRDKISAELDRAGFTALGFFESQGTTQGRGTHCFVAQRKDQGLTVVSFRGTDKDDPTDVGADADALRVPWARGGTVHQGFKLALETVLPGLQQKLPSITGRILFTGHSLGAALATLLASLRNPGALYTIGSPRVGDSGFVATLNQVQNYRYVDCCDIVTQIPPPLLGYQHVGQPYYIDRFRSIRFNPPESAIDEDRAAATLEFPLQHPFWQQGNVGVRQLADHSPVNYLTAIVAA